MSLNASVGPFERHSRCNPGSSVLSGVTSSPPKTRGWYARLTSVSSSGMSSMKHERTRSASSGYARPRQAARSALGNVSGT